MRTWVVRHSDEGEAQRHRWTFYEAIKVLRNQIIENLDNIYRILGNKPFSLLGPTR